jgi:SAM-dependent methyltransferase
VTDRFAADWLALREPFDSSARSVALARRLADRLPRRPRLMDLGAGTGSMFRFLAPIIGRGQDWILVDADAALLDDAFGRTAAWARRHHFAATVEGEELLVSTPHGLWRMKAVVHDLAAVPASGCDDADAVVCSALLDLVSASWLSRLSGKLTVPLLACLTVDGRDVWRPRHPFDALVLAAFRRDMQRDKGFGPALGTSVSSALAVTASAPSDWRIPRTALAMQRALIDGTADAARNARPAQAAAITAWQEARLRQALRGRLAITIGHRDILALPPGG